MIKKAERCKVCLTYPLHLLAVGLGSGLSPYFPGTVGSLLAIALWFPLRELDPIAYWSGLFIAAVAGIWICQTTAQYIGREDPSCIVWDEFVGMWITLYFLPSFSAAWILVAFLAFRFFDIAKPWPVCYFDQNIKDGAGIMLDDIAAGFIASFCITVLHLFV